MLKIKCSSHHMLIAGISAVCILTCNRSLTAQSATAVKADPRDDASPWGMGSSAEWMNEYPKFNPLLDKAGVKWIRLWNEWQGVQPKQGEWNWDATDKIVANAKENHIRVFGLWGFFAPWASADGGTRRGPIKDIKFWSDYAAASVERYKKDVKYWEVWNEFNGSFYEGDNKPKAYADLTVAAYDAAKKIDPTVKIGMSVANFDVGFLDAAIKAGAANHLDFICVHPYENLGTLAEGGEMGYLSLVGNLRDMLKANHQPADIPLWITEMGYLTPVKPDAAGDAKEANVLVKGYLLSIAQGFQRIIWFEARGPSYGKDADLGIIRADWTLRPAYDALKTMTTLLGPEPKYIGWLELGKGGYGFMFTGSHGNVLAAWAPPGKQITTTSATAVRVTDLAGKESKLPSGKELVLTEAPVFISDLPANVTQLAQANLGKPYPWGGDYAHAKVVTCVLGAVNRDDGLKQVRPETTAVVNGLADSCRRLDFNNPAVGGEGHYIYMRVDPQFVPYGTTNLEVTVVARRISADKKAGFDIMYESAKGYREAGKWVDLPEDDQWHELTWKFDDANFVGQWGFNFRINSIGSPNEFYVKEVRVKKN